jgi:hypothetical protein
MVMASAMTASTIPTLAVRFLTNMLARNIRIEEDPLDQVQLQRTARLRCQLGRVRIC